MFYSNIVKPGVLMYRPGYPCSAIGFRTSPQAIRPDGVALPTGEDKEGRQLFKLVLGKDELPGRFVLTDGLFVPVNAT